MDDFGRDRPRERERFERDLGLAESMPDFERRLLRARAVLTLRRLPVADGVMEHALRKARFALAARALPQGLLPPAVRETAHDRRLRQGGPGALDACAARLRRLRQLVARDAAVRPRVALVRRRLVLVRRLLHRGLVHPWPSGLRRLLVWPRRRRQSA